MVKTGHGERSKIDFWAAYHSLTQSNKGLMGSPQLITDLPGAPSSAPGTALDLRAYGINPGRVNANLSPAALTEIAVRRGEGHLTEKGALTALTGFRTGRSPQDRFVVPEIARANDIWWGPVN